MSPTLRPEIRIWKPPGDWCRSWSGEAWTSSRLGVPFSDPLADGPEIQAASQRALKHGVSLGDVLDLVADLRLESEIPVVLFTYFNPMHRFGLERLVDRAAEAGVDGILALDLPPEEAAGYKRLMGETGIGHGFSDRADEP